jgi:hypothetical protein
VPGYAAPGLYLEPPAPLQPPIDPLRTDIPAFIGIAERGPVGIATWVASWQEMTSTFGGFLPGAFLAYAVKAFFDNGGELCAIVRVAAPEVRTSSQGPATASDAPVASVAGFAPGAVAAVTQTVAVIATGPQPIDRLRTIVTDATPFAAGDRVMLSSAGAAAFSTVAATDPATGAVYWRAPLPTAIDISAPLTLTAELSAAQLVGAVAPATRTITWQAPLDGRFRVGASAPPLAIATGAARATAELTVDPGVPLLQVAAQSPGAWGDKLEVLVTRDLAGTFSLAVYASGELSELHARLSPVAGDPADATVAVAAASRLITVLSAARLSPDLAPTRLALSGGRDGSAAIVAEDFTGEPDDAAPRGLAAVRDLDTISILAVPDAVLIPERPLPAPIPLTHPPVDPCLLCPPAPPSAAVPPLPPVSLEAPPTLDDSDVLAIQQALIAQCEARRDRIALLDPPAHTTAAISSLIAWREQFDSSYAALYHPWVEVLDPLGGQALVRAIPPSGHVAGVLARTDLASGVWTPPANAVVEWAQAFSTAVDTGTQAVLNPLGINCLRTLSGRGLRVYGDRTLSSDQLLVYLHVRRLLAMIETAIGNATQWAVFEPADTYLRELIRISISSFLRELWQAGALVGAAETDAYFVQCDGTTNPPDQVALGRLIALVGVAPVQPAEFVVLRIARIDGSLVVTQA